MAKPKKEEVTTTEQTGEVVPVTEALITPPVEPEIAPQPVVEVEKVETPDSPAKLAYLDMMIAYKKQNPTKYAQKEQAFLVKLATL